MFHSRRVAEHRVAAGTDCQHRRQAVPWSRSVVWAWRSARELAQRYLQRPTRCCFLLLVAGPSVTTLPPSLPPSTHTAHVKARALIHGHEHAHSHTHIYDCSRWKQTALWAFACHAVNMLTCEEYLSSLSNYQTTQAWHPDRRGQQFHREFIVEAGVGSVEASYAENRK